MSKRPRIDVSDVPLEEIHRMASKCKKLERILRMSMMLNEVIQTRKYTSQSYYKIDAMTEEVVIAETDQLLRCFLTTLKREDSGITLMRAGEPLDISRLASTTIPTIHQSTDSEGE